VAGRADGNRRLRSLTANLSVRLSSPLVTPTTTEPRTSAVVVAWHHPIETVQSLESIVAMNPRPERVICIAQEFTAEETATLRALAAPGLVLEFLDANLGFSAAANLGIEMATAGGAEWILLVNNDATVTTDCLAACLEEARRDAGVAVVGPAVVFSADADRVWYAGGMVSRRFAYLRHHHLRGARNALPPTADTGYVPGCCALIRAAAWADIGVYREDYFLYAEDAEWAERARAAGWRLRYLGRVLCHHDVSVSTGGRGSLGLVPTSAYYLARNPLRFALETRPWSLRCTRIAGILSIWLPYNLLRAARSRSRPVFESYWAGTVDALRGRMGPRPAPTV
jgi:GT2 family glycosyltransferase